MTDSINHSFARIRIDSYNSLPIEKILTFHNVIILINWVVNKNKNCYYYKKLVREMINLIKYILKGIFVYYKCYIMIELTFLKKKMMLIKQVNQKSVIFVTIGIS